MNIKKFTAASLALVFTAFAAALVSLAMPSSANAAGNDGSDSSSTAKPESSGSGSGVSYVYIAQPGDSYTLMARKAVQTYGLKYDVNLSQGQILYAETHLTLEAGSPQINEGQRVTISEAAIKNWVEKAKNLNAGVVAGWNAYVPGVNFNTDNVGE